METGIYIIFVSSFSKFSSIYSCQWSNIRSSAVRSIHIISPSEPTPYEQYQIEEGLLTVEQTKNHNKYSYGFCTGTFISDRILITAVHCLYTAIKSRKAEKKVTIVLDHPTKGNLKALKIIVPNNIKAGLSSTRNDIAILEFPPHTSNYWIPLAKLENIQALSNGDLVTIYGFGMSFIPRSREDMTKQKGQSYSLKEIEDLYTLLQKKEESLIEKKAELEIAHINSQIQIYNEELTDKLPAKVIVKANYSNGRTTSDPFISYGDSGAPLLNSKGDLIGIQSRFILCQEFPSQEYHGFEHNPGDKLEVYSVIRGHSLCTHNGFLRTEMTLLTFDLLAYEIYKDLANGIEITGPAYILDL